MSKESKFQPFSYLFINRLLVIIIIGLAILAGYFHARMSNEARIANRLLSKYQTCQNSLTQMETVEQITPDVDISDF